MNLTEPAILDYASPPKRRRIDWAAVRRMTRDILFVLAMTFLFAVLGGAIGNKIAWAYTTEGKLLIQPNIPATSSTSSTMSQMRQDTSKLTAYLASNDVLAAARKTLAASGLNKTEGTLSVRQRSMSLVDLSYTASSEAVSKEMLKTLMDSLDKKTLSQFGAISVVKIDSYTSRINLRRECAIGFGVLAFVGCVILVRVLNLRRKHRLRVAVTI